MLNLTSEELERYAGYTGMSVFILGFADYNAGTMRAGWNAFHGVEQQAYDRGAECAMRRGR